MLTITIFLVNWAILCTPCYCANGIAIYISSVPGSDCVKVNVTNPCVDTKPQRPRPLYPIKPPYNKTASLIAGGVSVSERQFPFVVSLRNRTTGRHLCAGTFVTPRHVLTAAHCLEKRPAAADIYVTSGTVYEDGRNGTSHNVAELRIHEDYRGRHDNWRHDLAIVKLRERVVFDARRQAVKLPRANATVGSICFVVGWGSTNATTEQNPSVAQALTQIVIDYLTCKMEYFHAARIYGNHLCAVLERGAAPCEGDGGGPLMCDGKQHGITSFGARCDLGYPTVYTRLSYYLDWIKKKTKDHKPRKKCSKRVQTTHRNDPSRRLQRTKS